MKIKRSFIAFVGMIGLLASLASCSDWGQMDPAAGTDVYPTREKLSTLNFNESTSLEELGYVQSYSATAAEVVYDDFLYSQVLHLGGGTMTLLSPFTDVKLQKGAGFTFWLQTPEGVADATVLSVGGAELKLKGSPAGSTDVTTDGEWHFVAFQVWANNFQLYVDGEAVGTTAAENAAIIEAIDKSETITLSATDDIFVDDITFIRNQMNEKDYARPEIKKGNVPVPAPVYVATFETDLSDAEIVGAGSLTKDGDPFFGTVFQNVGGALRSNYLKLPADALSHSAESQEMTIGFWVNAANAGGLNDYTYAPFFTAYAAAPNPTNGAPMMALQSRGNVQVNNNGWCDFTSAQNVEGKNNIYHSNAWEASSPDFNFVDNWLSDNKWHYYCVTFKANEVTQYMDGEITNQWILDSSADGQNITGLFNNGADLSYICVGGNQAWDWGDNDGGFAFDDIAIWDKALAQAQVQQILVNKAGGGGGEDAGSKEYVVVGSTACDAGFWTVFSEPVMQLKDGETAHFGFINHTAGGNNWENWVLICTNNGGPSTGGDSEYFVLRADAWAWGQGFESPGNMTSDYNWDTFKADMNGAYVDLSATRKGGTITVTAVTTTASGTTFNMQFVYEGATAETCGLYFTLEKAYLELDPEECFVGKQYEPGTFVGKVDNTSGFWQEFTDVFGFKEGPKNANPFVFHFINHNKGAGSNWENWVFICTNNGGASTGGDSENFVLRADAWGWGSKWDIEGNHTLNQSFVWDTYPADMNGAECWVGVSHEGSTVRVSAPQKKANGEFFPEYSAEVGSIEGQIGCYFTLEGCHLEMLDAAYYPYFDKIGKKAN